MNSIILCTFVAVLIICSANGQDEHYGDQEPECISKGGLCITKSECDNPVLNNIELCPNQAKNGFQCCYGLPRSEHRCQKRGGECKPKNSCRDPLIYKSAIDCASNEDCCILVH